MKNRGRQFLIVGSVLHKDTWNKARVSHCSVTGTEGLCQTSWGASSMVNSAC